MLRFWMANDCMWVEPIEVLNGDGNMGCLLVLIAVGKTMLPGDGDLGRDPVSRH